MGFNEKFHVEEQALCNLKNTQYWNYGVLKMLVIRINRRLEDEFYTLLSRPRHQC